MAPGSEAVFTLVVRVPMEVSEGASLEYVATVTGAAADARAENNTGHLTVTTKGYAQIPYITSVVARDVDGKPWRLKLYGSNFVDGIEVYIGDDTTPWPGVKVRADNHLVLKGSGLKTRFPEGVQTRILVINPGGASAGAYFRP
jgi:hypothetical protein